MRVFFDSALIEATLGIEEYCWFSCEVGTWILGIVDVLYMPKKGHGHDWTMNNSIVVNKEIESEILY